MNNSPKISVIVPVYKVEKYLSQCLDSILAQTFKDFEVLLIDDGSPDKSGEICDKYAQKDSRVRVFHKENGGVSSARNLGLDNARGEWLYFVDSDDTLYSNALSVLVSLIEDDVDAIMAGYTISPEYIESIFIKPISFLRKKISVYDALVEMYKPTDFPYQGYLWCKLFKRTIIEANKLKFNDSIYFNEDRLFIVEYLSKCNSLIAYTTEPVYGYVNRLSGAMSSLKKNYNPKFATDFDAYVMMYNIIKTYTSDTRLHLLAKEGIALSFINNMRMMEKFNCFDNDVYRHMRTQIRNSIWFKFLFIVPCRTFVGNLLRLLCPSMAVKINNK